MRRNNFIERSGIFYSVERNSSTVSEYKGLINTEQSTGKRYIGFYPDADIQIGDFLISPYGDKYFVKNKEVATFTGQPYELKCYIVPEAEYATTQPSNSPVFNIQNAYGSVIGTQANVTLNYNDTLQSVKEQINSTDSPDKEELQQIILLLEMVVNNQVPAQKGLLSKFSEVMERHSWLTSPICSVLLGWLTAQIGSPLP